MPRYLSIFSGDEDRAELATQMWREVVAALRAIEAITMPNLARADRYVRTRVEYESLYPQVAKEGPVKKGPNEGDVFNFKWSACEKLSDRLLKLEKAMFGEAANLARKEKPTAGETAADEFL